MMRCFEKFLCCCLIALIAVAVCARPLKKGNSRFHRDLRKRLASSRYFGDVEFTPCALPCQYVINRTWIVVESDNEVDYEYDIFSVHGPLFKSLTDVPGQMREDLLFRPDVRIADPKSDKIYVPQYDCITFFDPPCTDLLYEEEAALDIMGDYLDWFYGTWVFTKQAPGEFQGRKCKVYYRYEAEDQADVYLYATDDNLIIGLNVFTPDANETAILDYTYSAPQSLFIIDKTVFDSLNDTRAFNPPSFEPCH